MSAEKEKSTPGGRIAILRGTLTARNGRLAGLFAVLLLVTACSLIRAGQTDEKVAQNKSETITPTAQTTRSHASMAEIDAGEGPTLAWKRVPLAGIEHRDISQNRLLFDSERFFLLADSVSYVSDSGEAWREIGLRLPWNETSWSSLAAYDGLVVMATSLPEIITWSFETSATQRFSPSFSLEGIPDLGNTVAAGPQGILVTYFIPGSSGNVVAVYFSRNGEEWTQVDPDLFAAVQYPSITAIHDGFLSVDSSGYLMFSADGLTWKDLSPKTNVDPKKIPDGLTTWGEKVLAFPVSAFSGPSVGLGPYTVLHPDGIQQLPEPGLPALEGTYVGLGGHLDAGEMGIVAAFVWDPHLPASSGCCSPGQAVGVVEFSPDGTTWTRRQFPEEILFISGLAVGKDRVLLLAFDEPGPPVPTLWIGLPTTQ